MSEVLSLNMGELTVATSPSIIETNGVGSCVAVCLYSSLSHSGAMAHIMLPKRVAQDLPIDENSYRYADVAIKVMVEKLVAMGIRQQSLIAKIAGGSNMFPDVQGRSHKVGEKNIEAVKENLALLGISIVAEHTGGTFGRSVYFDLGNGIVTIKSNI